MARILVPERQAPWCPYVSITFFTADTLHHIPIDKVTCSFVLPISPDGSVELGLHRIRGWDVLGGHVEPGETPGFAALRELEEESGRVLKETDLTLLGYERLREANRETYFVYYIAQVSKAETVCNVRDDYNDWNGSNDYEAMTTTRFFKADDLTREKWFLERPGILGALTDLVYKLEANNT